MTDYEFYKSIGVCPRCRRERIAQGRSMCPNCLDVERIRKAEKWERMTEQQKQDQNARAEKARKIRYERRIEAGECVCCGKPAVFGRYCYTHRIKYLATAERCKERRREERYGNETVTERRKREGKCLYCEEPALPGRNICEKHLRIFSENGKRSKQRNAFESVFTAKQEVI